MAILIFKQGVDSETGSLAYAEPIFHTHSNTLVISGSDNRTYRLALVDKINTGSIHTTGDFSGSNLLLDGNATIRGNITMGGSGLDFGDAADDNIVFKADISSSIIPDSSDSFNLGSDGQRWNDLYVSGAISASGGHFDFDSDTFIDLNAASRFDVDAGGILSLDSTNSITIGTAQDVPVNIDASTFDVDASSILSLDASRFDIGIAGDSPMNVEVSTFNLGASGYLHLSSSATLDVDATGAITINGESTTAISSSGALSIDSETGINIGTTTDKPIDIDSTTLDIDASGAITIDGTSTLALSSSDDLSIDSETSIKIGTEQDVLLDIHSARLDLDSTGKITIDSSHVDGIQIGTAIDRPFKVESSTFDIDASGAITINGESTTAISSSGALSVDSETGINIGTTTDKPIDIDASTLDIDASGALTIDSATSIGIGTNADKPIDIDSTTFDLDASGNITLDSTTAINVGTATSGVPISIGHTTSETTVNDNLTVTGNFTVNGTTTYVSSSNVTIGDRIIELNYLGASGNGGLYVGDADGTSTSGSLLWDSSNDYWIAGAKDLEKKILLSNGDSIISGSGVNNQIPTFTGTHGVDSSANLTFDGSILRITGTQEITSNLSGSASGSFKNINVAESQLIGNDLYVGGTIFHKDDTDTKIVFTDDDINITVGNTNMIDFTQDTVSEITINEAAQNLDVRIEGEADSKLFFTDASVSKIGIGTNTPGEKLTIHGNVSGSASGSFKDVNVADNVTVDGTVRAEVLEVTGSENILATFQSTDSAAKIVLKDVDGQGARFSYVGGSDTVGIGQSNSHNSMAIHVNNDERVAIGSNHTIPHAVLDVSGSLIVSGTQEIKFGDLTVHQSGSFGRVIGSIGATNGVVSGSGQSSTIDHDQTTNFVANEHIDHSSVSITGTAGLAGGGNITTNRSLTLDTGSNTFTEGITEVLNDLEVQSGSMSTETLQSVTNNGATSSAQITFTNATDSTSKTTGAVVISGGLGVNNTINAGGDVIAFASSDERLKDNIKPIENPLEVISQISGNTFDWNSEKQNIYNGKDYGVIAQEIQKVMPELVDTRDSGYLAVKYDKIVPLLIESIKELKKEIEELKSK